MKNSRFWWVHGKRETESMLVVFMFMWALYAFENGDGVGFFKLFWGVEGSVWCYANAIAEL